MRALRWAVRIGAGLLGLAFAVYLFFAYAPAGDGAPHPFNQDRNAVWLEHRWLTRRQSEEDMEALVGRLKGRGIAYVYPHLIPFNASGRLPLHDREQLRAFLSVVRRVAPGMRVLPWVGGSARATGASARARWTWATWASASGWWPSAAG